MLPVKFKAPKILRSVSVAQLKKDTNIAVIQLQIFTGPSSIMLKLKYITELLLSFATIPTYYICANLQMFSNPELQSYPLSNESIVKCQLKSVQRCLISRALLSMKGLNASYRAAAPKKAKI